MKKIVFYCSLLVFAAFVSSCEEMVTMGEFEVDSEMMAEVLEGDTIPPSAPVNFEITANCDRSVTFTWDAMVRANGYKLVEVDSETGDEILIANDIADTTYTHPDVLELTEFRLYSKNPKNTSFTFTTQVGISGGTPDAPTGLSASDATGKSVKLSWDEMLYAETYEVWKGGVLIAGSLTNTYFEDNDAADTFTEYIVTASSSCGTSIEATADGRAGSDVEIPLHINFETSDLETAIDPLGFTADYGGAWDNGYGFTSIYAYDENTLAYGDKYCVHVQQGPTEGSTWQLARGMNLTLPAVTLEVGATYELSFELKTPAVVNLQMPSGDVGGLGGDDVWKTFTHQFTAVEAIPEIKITQWYNPGGPRTNCYDNFIIKKL